MSASTDGGSRRLVKRRALLKYLAAALPALQMNGSFLRMARAQGVSSPPADTRIPRKGESKRVLILGAGLSGLVAGYELMRAGHEVTVLEGRMRPGGRVHTLRTPFSDGLIAEAGAGRIPIDHHWTYAYIRQFGLVTEAFAPASLATVLLNKGKRTPVMPSTRFTDQFALHADEKNLTSGELAQRYLVPALREVISAGDLGAADWPPASLKKFDQYPFVQFMPKQGASQGAVDILFSGALPMDASTLWAMRVLAATDFDHLEKITGGNDLLPRAIADRLANRVVYGARVVAFAEDSAGVHVSFVQGGKHQKLDADYLICTLPFSALRLLESTPVFSALKQRAIREMHYASVVKVALQTPTRGWEKEGLSGFAKTDQNAEVWSPGWNAQTPRGLLQLYQEGSLAQRLDQMAPEARLRFAADSIEAVFPGSRPDVSKGVSHSWQLEEFSRGAYCVLRPGDLTSWYPAAAAVEGRVHFAGEHLSPVGAFMQGAIMSGHRAAMEVNDRPR